MALASEFNDFCKTLFGENCLCHHKLEQETGRHHFTFHPNVLQRALAIFEANYPDFLAI